MTNHLGSWVSALADGQLGPAATERALAHVAGCPSCAAELAAARLARQALAGARDVEPAPDLTARLLALAGPAPSGDESPDPERRRRVVPLGMSAYATPARALSGELNPRQRPGLRLAAGSLAGLGVFAMVLFVLGGEPSVVPTLHPAQALSMLGHARGPGGTASGTLAPELAAQISNAASSSGTSQGNGGVTEAAVLRWMSGTDWTCPAGLPTGYEVTAARLVGDAGSVLEVDLAGPDGNMVLTEQRGRLDGAALTGVRRHAVGDRMVYVLTSQPWHGVWQSGDTIVSVVSEAATPSVTALVGGFPADGYDDGPVARLARGWDLVTGASRAHDES